MCESCVKVSSILVDFYDFEHFKKQHRKVPCKQQHLPEKGCECKN